MLVVDRVSGGNLFDLLSFRLQRNETKVLLFVFYTIALSRKITAQGGFDLRQMTQKDQIADFLMRVRVFLLMPR
jgi:hypothetical protein